MNNQQRKDLATRSIIGDSMIGLLRRSRGLHLLTFNQGINEHTAHVPLADVDGKVPKLVDDGFSLAGFTIDGKSMVFRKMVGMFYPLAAGMHRRFAQA